MKGKEPKDKLQCSAVTQIVWLVTAGDSSEVAGDEDIIEEV